MPSTVFITHGGASYRLKGKPAHGLGGATAGFFFGFAAVALFGPTARVFQESLQLSPLLVGLLVATPALSGSLLRIPFAAWADTTGGRTPFLVLLWLSVAGMTGLSLMLGLLYPGRMSSGLYPLLLLLGILCGCGIATFSVGITQVSYWFPQRRQGFALGTYAGAGNLAPGIFSLVVPLALGTLGLAGTYVLWLALLVAGTALYHWLGLNAPFFQLMAQGLPLEQAKAVSRTRGQELFPGGRGRDSLRIAGRTGKTWVLVALYFTSFGGFIALTAWLPTYWSAWYRTGLVAAGALAGAYAVLTSAVRIPGGVLSDRLGGERTALLAFLTMLVGAAVMAGSQSFALSVAATVVLALGMGTANAAVFKLVPQEVPEAVGGAAGLVGGVGAFGGFAIPPLLGAMVRAQGQTGYARGFVVFVGLAALCVGLSYALGRARTRRGRRSEGRIAPSPVSPSP